MSRKASLRSALNSCRTQMTGRLEPRRRLVSSLTPLARPCRFEARAGCRSKKSTSTSITMRASWLRNINCCNLEMHALQQRREPGIRTEHVEPRGHVEPVHERRVFSVCSLEPADCRVLVTESSIGERDVERRQITTSVGGHQRLDESLRIGTLASDGVAVGEVCGVADAAQRRGAAERVDRLVVHSLL